MPEPQVLTFRNARARTPTPSRNPSLSSQGASRADTPVQVRTQSPDSNGHVCIELTERQQEQQAPLGAGPDPEYPVECQAIALFMHDYQTLPTDPRLFTKPMLFLRELYISTPRSEAIHAAIAAPAIAALAQHTNRPDLVSSFHISSGMQRDD